MDGYREEQYWKLHPLVRSPLNDYAHMPSHDILHNHTLIIKQIINPGKYSLYSIIILHNIRRALCKLAWCENKASNAFLKVHPPTHFSHTPSHTSCTHPLPPPPPPQLPSNSVKDTHNVLALKDRNPTLFGDWQREGGGVRGLTFMHFVHIFPHSWKKLTQGHLLTQKE